MAFTNFYLIAGGAGSADINAGSTIGAAVVGATTNGNWNSTTGVFISTGTPFGAASAGDYASIYVDGATVTTFVAKILTVDSTAQITVDVATIKYGTAPSTSATARSCVVGGSWSTEQVLAAGGLATTTVPQATKINIKGDLTTTAARTISMAGATTTPLWFSGYNTTPGDLDADTTNSLAKPVWTFGATFQFICSGAHQLWSGLSIVGNRSGFQWRVTGAARIVRCRCENTSSNAAAAALTTDSTNGTAIAYSWFKAPSTGTSSAVVDMAVANMTCVGVVAEGGGLAGFNVAAQAGNVCLSCVGLNNTGAGFLASTGNLRVLACTVYGATVDGVKWSGTPSAGAMVVGCLFSGLNGSTATTNGINSASGTNTNVIFRACNDYYNVTNPEVGFGDSFAFFPRTDSSPVVTSGTDMTPVSTANAINNGFPGTFENESFKSYPSIGAVEPVAASGSGGGVAIFGS
jgi:hypothetical protein